MLIPVLRMFLWIFCSYIVVQCAVVREVISVDPDGRMKPRHYKRDCVMSEKQRKKFDQLDSKFYPDANRIELNPQRIGAAPRKHDKIAMNVKAYKVRSYDWW